MNDGCCCREDAEDWTPGFALSCPVFLFTFKDGTFRMPRDSVWPGVGRGLWESGCAGTGGLSEILGPPFLHLQTSSLAWLAAETYQR